MSRAHYSTLLYSFPTLNADLSSLGSYTEHCVLEESIHRTIVVLVLLRCLYKAMRNGLADLVPLLAFLLVPKNAMRREEDVYSDGSKSKRGDEKVTYLLYIKEWNKGTVGSIREYEYLLLSA
jgi:hypothetical protein